MEFNRTKKEVAREVEQTRSEAKRVFRNAGEIWSGRNAMASAWRSTKSKYHQVHDNVSARVHATNDLIRENIYASVCVAVGVGAILGFLSASRKKKKC